MTTTSAMPTARKRRRKTRTKTVSHRSPIVASTLKANEIDLAPGKEHLVCPDCSTWCPITGMLGTPKLVPHNTRRAGTTDPRRCCGSNRRVTVDVEVDAWRTELVEAVPTTASRRATKVLPKPKVKPAPAASQVKPAPLSAEQVRQAFRQHQQQCPACKGEVTGRDGQRLPCRDGERLAVTFLRLLRQEPKRRIVREFFARERQRFDRQYAAPAKRTAEWAAVLPAVQDADTRRVQLPVGDAPTEGRSVPLETLHPAR
ncbi:hypothetical protein [Streptomyces afghaniensis]|uniref:hypothetical protein n=1 Tax=Streptomyces afghaniensis TaxID=66865 RepID=UPI0027829280|nr:hypothetical protein [Streptomyces afghaniensis]MDQ1013512.1 uncharacterized protein YbaR (Trm112 family) [Streptomyces afghaniensis]